MKKQMIFFVPIILFFTMASCQKENPEPRNALADWAGEYHTRTQWWGEYFSPMLIGPDGSLTVAGDPIAEYTFDETTGKLTFDWHPVKTTEAKASFTFKEFGENKTFSGSINPRKQDGPVGFRGATMAHTLWQGSYVTETQWWGAYFSPLVIEEDGKMYIADTEIDFTFDPVNEKLSFDWHEIKTTKALAEITFSEQTWKTPEFSGRIRPRPQDGWVSFTGTRN
jgi:hypothetical protein